jgi:urease accessory protein
MRQNRGGNHSIHVAIDWRRRAHIAKLLTDQDQMKGIATMKRIALIATSVLISATPAFAHAGHGIASGFMHPLLGWDHLAAMLAVGAWGAMLGARAIWAAPLAFVAAIIAGAALGMAGVELPFVETMILASVVVLVGFVVTQVKMPVWSGMAIIGLFALAHGFAHSSEMPAIANAWVYGAGFATATLMIHALGAITAMAVMKLRAVKA